MSDTNTSLGLPYMSESQSQKEVVFNQMVNILGMIIQSRITGIANTPPVSPTEGVMYVVGTSPTGAWVGKSNQLAQYIYGTWVYYVPFDGLRIWDKSTNTAIVYKSGVWQHEIAAQDKIGFFGATPVTKTTVTMVNTDGAIGSLSIGSTYSQAEVQALRNANETLADDVRAIKSALSALGLL